MCNIYVILQYFSLTSGRISRLKATTPRRGHFRNLSDTSADGCQSPALYDSPDEQSIYMRRMYMKYRYNCLGSGNFNLWEGRGPKDESSYR